MEHKKLCRTPGCRNLTSNRRGYCDECMSKIVSKAAQNTKERSDSDLYRKGYHTRSWMAFSKKFLLSHPFCAICGAPATVCDHKTMTARQMIDAYDCFTYNPDEYQALCNRCNVKKGWNEDKQSDVEYFQQKNKLETLGEE